MGVFEMVAIIVVTGIVAGMYKERLNTTSRIESQSGELQDLINKIDSLENRMNSIEELTLEREKERRFEDISH